ncbi:hypothetical protein [Streptococcus pneumoniae]|uniref:hypothetical protein n=1 Tax=Streptococcus pneumoniae TaxID=1313 RepID=UPI000B587C09|nr:hypothetical protein [Streptococcus pneumoniae]SNL07632.1 chlorohydrolase [Streptococcus pneumoniae]
MKIKEQTRKLATGCSKHSFEIELTKSAQNTVLRLWMDEVSSKHGFEMGLELDRTDEVSLKHVFEVGIEMNAKS